jgi:GNAT superfamily N-acetyltransferase
LPQEVLVRTFHAGDEIDFRRLNLAWIEKYFGAEAKDLQAFEDPQSKIVDMGGEIFIATIDEIAVGCVALLKLSDGEFEVAKMATDERYQRRGIGRSLMDAAIQWAHAHRARRLYLETNHTLDAAQRLYASVGFQRIPPQPSPYKRADVFMELLLD